MKKIGEKIEKIERKGIGKLDVSADYSELTPVPLQCFGVSKSKEVVSCEDSDDFDFALFNVAVTGRLKQPKYLHFFRIFKVHLPGVSFSSPIRKGAI